MELVHDAARSSVMKCALVLIAVTACQQGPAPAAQHSQGSAVQPPPPPIVIADAARAIDAAPAIDAPADAGDPTEHLFELAPAQITRDGKHVLVKVVDDDGARGLPNLILELRDRTDRTTDRVVVVRPDEQLDDATRIKRAAAADQMIKSIDLVPLVELQRGSDHDGRYSDPAVTVDWGHEHFTLTLNGKRVLDRAVPSAWRGRSYFDKLADLTCSNPDFLRGVYVAAAARLAVVDVAYRGNDTCWEPTGQLHIVTW